MPDKAPILLPSGQSITMEDYNAMRKQIVKETLKNVAAVIGVVAVYVVISSWAKNRNSDNTDD